MLQGLRTVNYPVPDLAAATTWYSELLGVRPYFEEPFYVGFNVGGYELGLFPAEEGEVTLTYWGVEDARLALAALVVAGAQVRSDVQDVGEGILLASVIDPAGNVLGIIENPHFALPA